jgi:hypothetical protein
VSQQAQERRLHHYARLLADAMTLLDGVRESMQSDGLDEPAALLSHALLGLEESWAEVSQRHASVLIGTGQTASGEREGGLWLLPGGALRHDGDESPDDVPS